MGPLEAEHPVRGQEGAGPQGRAGVVGLLRTAGAVTGSRGRPDVTMVTPRPFTTSDQYPECGLVLSSVHLCYALL